MLYEVVSGVATLTLNRPTRLNAWTDAMEAVFFAHLDTADADPDVRVIVVTGAGRGWCAGADMDGLQGIGASAERGAESEPSAARPAAADAGVGVSRRPVAAVRDVRKPVIAAVNGACAGIGMAMALFCDLRFAAAGAKFTTAFARRGLVAEHGMSWTLPRLVGTSRALDLLYSARVVLAEEALTMGLVDRVFPADALLDETMAYAQDLAVHCSPTSMAVMKRQVWNDWDRDLRDSMVDADHEMHASFARADFKEGVASFVEKRTPAFPPL